MCLGALGAHIGLGVENLLCCIQLLCVVSEQLPKSSGELMFKLSYLKLLFFGRFDKTIQRPGKGVNLVISTQHHFEL